MTHENIHGKRKNRIRRPTITLSTTNNASSFANDDIEREKQRTDSLILLVRRYGDAMGAHALDVPHLGIGVEATLSTARCEATTLLTAIFGRKPTHEEVIQVTSLFERGRAALAKKVIT